MQKFFYTRFREPYSNVFKPYSNVLKPYNGVFLPNFLKNKCDCPIPGSGSPIVTFSCKFFFFFFKVWSPYTKFMESYSDVLKPYSGVLELDLPKVKFYDFFFFFKFDRA